MGNSMWKAMCLAMCAIIATMNLGVVVDVVKGRAWDKGIM
jgi:hypothetical protein